MFRVKTVRDTLRLLVVPTVVTVTTANVYNVPIYYQIVHRRKLNVHENGSRRFCRVYYLSKSRILFARENEMYPFVRVATNCSASVRRRVAAPPFRRRKFN